MTGNEQARLLGLLLWLLTGFQFFLVVFIGAIYVAMFGFVLASAPHKQNDPPPELVAGILIVFMIIVLVMTALFAIPKVVAGYGLRKQKSWAKVWAIIACIMACMSFPFGTAVGVYGLVFIFGDAGKAYFDNPGYGKIPTGAYTPPPPPNSWQ